MLLQLSEFARFAYNGAPVPYPMQIVWFAREVGKRIYFEFMIRVENAS